jgi:hypothetical protein
VAEVFAGSLSSCGSYADGASGCDEPSADCHSVLVAGGAFCDFTDDLDLAIHEIPTSTAGRALSQVQL